MTAESIVRLWRLPEEMKRSRESCERMGVADGSKKKEVRNDD